MTDPGKVTLEAAAGTDPIGVVRNSQGFSDPQAALHARYVAAMRAHKRACRIARARGQYELSPGWPRWPDLAQFEGLRCGARAKSSGKPCRLTEIYSNGRCKFHGGCSTGPKTAEGKAASSRNACKRGPAP